MARETRRSRDRRRRRPSFAPQPMPPTSDTPPPASAPPPSPGRAPRLPSLRVSAALAAGMLALGVVIGAAIGPAPSASLAGTPIQRLLPAIAALALRNTGHTDIQSAQPPPVAPPAATPQPTPAATSAGTGASGTAPVGKPKTAPRASVSPTSGTNTSKTPTPGGGGATTQKPLPPTTHVWLIALTGATFTQALSQPAAAPYIDSQLVPAGALLGDWPSLAGSALASEAGLLGGEPPQTLDSIVQPPCPEGAVGAQCKPETAGALSAASEFLAQTVPAIVASPAYREHGLIVITFGAIGNATASSLPAGAATATLSSESPAGVLLLSPFVRAGTRPHVVYDPSAPRRSLSELLR